MAAHTTKLSSKGQIVIPEEIRHALGLNEGDQFIVIGEGDTVILKALPPLRMGDFEALLKRARLEASRAGIKKANLKAAIAKIRRRTE